MMLVGGKWFIFVPAGMVVVTKQERIARGCSVENKPRKGLQEQARDSVFARVPTTEEARESGGCSGVCSMNIARVCSVKRVCPTCYIT